MAGVRTASLTALRAVTAFGSRAAIGVLIGLLVALATLDVRATWLDPHDYYTYQGVTGPFEISGGNGTPHAGPPITSVHPGQSFAWVSTLCFAAGVSAQASVMLRDRATDAVITQRNFEITPLDRRCGPKLFSLLVPADAPPGDYQVDRVNIITPPHGWPVSSALPPIDIEVTAP